MKTKLLILILLSCKISLSQPKVIFDFCTHNEEVTSWDLTNYYQQNRLKLVTLSNYFQQNGITWNMQSDWKYLINVINQDSTYFPLTEDKNILSWMYENMGVEMDPHGHETEYIYPDLVKLMDSIGLPESKVMGGTLYAQENGINLWTNLINGQNGLIFPEKFWQPDYMMGGGTPQHVADLKYYGFWNPKSETEYLTHEPTNHLRHLGVGCEIKIKEDISVEEVVSDLKYLVSNVQNGNYPSDGFYFQSIFFEQGDLNNATFYQKVIDIADSANAIVASGEAEWLTMKQAYTKWETDNNAEIFQWECGLTLSINENKQSSIKIYPNPTSNILQIDNLVNSVELIIYSINGSVLKQENLNSINNTIDLEKFSKGIYFLNLKNSDGEITQFKIEKN